MQLAMHFKTWGGKRKRAGRKPSGPRAGVSHVARPVLDARHPAHVTLEVGRHIPGLRKQALMRALRAAFKKGRERGTFRMVHFSVQADHVHFLAEAADRIALSRGVQALSIRIARKINAALSRSGKVFADRYHARALSTPREVRNALRYVLLNAHKHSVAAHEKIRGLDPCSSADTFDGWLAGAPRGPESSATLVMSARTWLLRVGWRRGGGLLSPIP